MMSSRFRTTSMPDRMRRRRNECRVAETVTGSLLPPAAPMRSAAARSHARFGGAFFPTMFGLFGAALLVVVSGAVSASPVRFEVNPGGEGTEVVFASKAPMESFEGKTDQVQGSIVLDPAALGDSIVVVVEVDLASLDTGLALRNQHMRENHLETETYPKATFRGGHLEGFPAALSLGETLKGKARGSFDLHGVVRPMEADVSLTLRSDGALAVHAEFEVVLADYEIDRPKFLMLKLDEKQHVTVDLIAQPAG